MRTHDCKKCWTPYRSNHPTPGVCPYCRIREREWGTPSALAQALMDQIDAILEVHDWQSRDVHQLLAWLKDAERREAGMGPS